jgi:hypothetical protein
VVTVQSFDDTTFRLTPDIVTLSETILSTAGDALRARCPEPPPPPLSASRRA